LVTEAKILPNLTRFGYPIKRSYDKYANPIEDKPKETNVKESEKNAEAISAFAIVDGYLKAIGGKEEVKKANTIRAAFTMEMMGRKFEAPTSAWRPTNNTPKLKWVK
jgi:hypothetical protein